MKKRICKHKAIAKGNGERYWKCIFCGQKVADPTQLINKTMKNKNPKENWEKLVMRIEKITLDCHLNSISQEEARDEILEFLQSEREKWEEEKIMAIDKRILDKIKREQGTDEFYETIVKPIEKRVKNQLLEKIKLKKFEILEGNKYKKGKEEGFWVQTNYALGYNQAIADFISLSYRNFDSRNFYRNFNNVIDILKK